MTSAKTAINRYLATRVNNVAKYTDINPDKLATNSVRLCSKCLPSFLDEENSTKCS